MKANQSESPSDVWRWFQNQAESLGPAVLGSLSLRRSPCVRENCPACLSGEQHASYVLYGRLKGRRFGLSMFLKNLCRRYTVVWKTGVLCRICSTKPHRVMSKL